MELSYPTPRSPSRKLYQWSPNPKAVPRLFLIGDAPDERQVSDRNRSRIRRVPGPGQTICPYTGFIADDEEFLYPDDINLVKQQILHDAASDTNDWLGEWAREVNRTLPRDGFVTMQLEYKPSHRPPRPVAIREDLLRDLACDVCERSYAVYAIALFCPDCGAPNLTPHFRREVAIVREQLAIAAAQDRADGCELTYRLMGNAHEDVLTAFETTLKTVYRYLVRRLIPQRAEEMCAKRAIGNAFQNIRRAREKFVQLGIDVFAVLSDEGLSVMALNIEKRHVIGHNLGIADEPYIALAQADELGQTIPLIGEEIGRFADSCLAVIERLEVALLPNAELRPSVIDRD